MADIGELVARIRADTKALELGLTQGTKKIEKFSKHSTGKLTKIDEGFRTLGRTIITFAGAAVLGRLVVGIVKTSVEMERLTRSLNAAVGSAEEGAKAYAHLRSESDRLGLIFKDNVKSFSQISAAAKGTTLAGKGVRDIFEAISEAVTVFQLPAGQAKNAFFAIGQIISKNVVSAEELRRQLGDQLPGAFQIAARGMNVTTQELNKMLVTGKLLAEDFLPKFAAQIKRELAGDVPAAASTAQAAFNRLSSAWTDVQVAIAKAGLLSPVKTSAEEITRLLKWITDHAYDFEIAWISVVQGIRKAWNGLTFAWRTTVRTIAQIWAAFITPAATIFEVTFIKPVKFLINSLVNAFMALRDAFPSKRDTFDPVISGLFKAEKALSFADDGVNRLRDSFGEFIPTIKGYKDEFDATNTIIERQTQILLDDAAAAEKLRAAFKGFNDEGDKIVKTGSKWEQFVTGLGKGFTKLKTDVLDFTKLGEKAFTEFANAAMDTMSDVLFDGLTTGFDNIKDIWKSLMHSMLRVATDTAAKIAFKFTAEQIGLSAIFAAGGVGGAGGGVAGAAALAPGAGLLPTTLAVVGAAAVVNALSKTEEGRASFAGGPMVGGTLAVADALGFGDTLRDTFGIGGEKKPANFFGQLDMTGLQIDPLKGLTTQDGESLFDALILGSSRSSRNENLQTAKGGTAVPGPIQDIVDAFESITTQVSESLMTSIEAMPANMRDAIIGNFAKIADFEFLGISPDINTIIEGFAGELTEATQEAFEAATLQAIEDMGLGITGTFEEQVTKVIDAANASSALVGAALMEGLKSNDFDVFSRTLRESVFDAVLQGLIQAVMQTSVLQGALQGTFLSVGEILERATAGGKLDTSILENELPGVFESIDETINMLQPLFDILSDLSQDIGSSLGVETGAGVTDVDLDPNNARLADESVNITLQAEVITTPDVTKWLSDTITDVNNSRTGQEIKKNEITQAGV